MDNGAVLRKMIDSSWKLKFHTFIWSLCWSLGFANSPTPNMETIQLYGLRFSLDFCVFEANKTEIRIIQFKSCLVHLTDNFKQLNGPNLSLFWITKISEFVNSRHRDLTKMSTPIVPPYSSRQDFSFFNFKTTNLIMISKAKCMIIEGTRKWVHGIPCKCNPYLNK